MYVRVSVYVLDDRYLKKDFIFRITVSNSQRNVSSCRLLVCGLGVKMDKEMCPRESTVF